MKDTKQRDIKQKAKLDALKKRLWEEFIEQDWTESSIDFYISVIFRLEEKLEIAIKTNWTEKKRRL